jgi:hypothetical protein
VPVRLQQQVDDLVAAIRAFERARTGRLAAVTLGVPPAFRDEPIASAVRDALAAAGNHGVEVAARATNGALRVVSVEFARDVRAARILP